MAITDVPAYAHLSADDIAAFGRELDAIEARVRESLGAEDANYIRRTIVFQRVLDLGSRLVVACSRSRSGWLLGVAGLATAKCVENMEIGHNVGHGQWDWMNDPEIHSSAWEWDMMGVSSQWRFAHNYRHHVFTNIVGMDDDVGFGIMRVTRDQLWYPALLLQPLQNLFLAATFEWGIAVHSLYAERDRARTTSEARVHTRAMAAKIARQLGKDYVLFPLLSGRRWRRTLIAALSANALRNLWAYLVIFCGHFPDGAEKFTPAVIEDETKPEWYLRQLLGTANFDAGPVLGFLSGHLCHQIEHHLFPDLPSNRYPEIAVRVRELCEKYDLPYTTGPLARQYLLTLRTINKLALPDQLLRATADDAPETASERKFLRTAVHGPGEAVDSPRRRGLLTALREAKARAGRHRR
ncbi:fatty acid desaturase family protein [Nocardia arizonensis]|uniref:fatty acid desaturase family protein n=1 Tax=Nocardia arizonensis TaxID=1141647 RepID=UPI0006D22FC5|nr:fatty acid desaturase [Nocardia arizonensis]